MCVYVLQGIYTRHIARKGACWQVALALTFSGPKGPKPIILIANDYLVDHPINYP